MQFAARSTRYFAYVVVLLVVSSGSIVRAEFASHNWEYMWSAFPQASARRGKDDKGPATQQPVITSTRRVRSNQRPTHREPDRG
jgi:hypothetical protein